MMALPIGYIHNLYENSDDELTEIISIGKRGSGMGIADLTPFIQEEP